MTSRRQRRVAELIHEEISNILQFNIHDPRLGLITVTSVEISPDLKEATIYISYLSGEKKEILAGLQSATPFFRRELGQKITLRHTPALHFKLDNSLAYGQKIDTLLSRIDIPPASDDEPGGDDA